VRFRDSKLIRFGIGGLVLGSGPLLLAVAIAHLRGDPNPNPVGPGMLAGLTFLPSLLCVAIGIYKVWSAKKRV
jgi:hypothetical protein